MSEEVAALKAQNAKLRTEVELLLVVNARLLEENALLEDLGFPPEPEACIAKECPYFGIKVLKSHEDCPESFKAQRKFERSKYRVEREATCLVCRKEVGIRWVEIFELSHEAVWMCRACGEEKRGRWEYRDAMARVLDNIRGVP